MSHASAAAPSLVLERMSPFQWTAIAICVLLNMLDGFDVMVMAFTAPHVSADWELSGKVLGLMLSAGLVGMALVLLASIVWFTTVERRFMPREILIGLFLTVTTPVTLILLARAALFRDRTEGAKNTPRKG